MTKRTKRKRTSEHVSAAHPDKFCDQVADRILDEALARCGSDLALRRSVRTAIECLAKDQLVFISGEVRLPVSIQAALDLPALAFEVWRAVGYGTSPRELSVIDHVQDQSGEIARMVDEDQAQGKAIGAGDQGIMCGYATVETPGMMPREWLLARDLCIALRDRRLDGSLPWLRSDSKTQVTLDADDRPSSIIIATQHAPGVALEQVRQQVFDHVVVPLLGSDLDPARVKINGAGEFITGGPFGDCGVVGRKLCVDAYGPQVPVGGGAYSGKDPTKVDRSAAYMARAIAKSVVTYQVGNARECTVKVAYAIGQTQPEMVTAETDSGLDVTEWVQTHFPDLSPGHIIDRFGLLRPVGWSYFETASYGHYGRGHFPWEQVETTL